MFDAKKFELNDEDLDNVSGGTFNYMDTTGDGVKDTCKVDGVGTYHCNAQSKANIITLYLQNQNLSPAELVELAIAKGYLW